MSARILDGKKIRQEIIDELRDEVSALEKLGIRPGLAAVLVGNDSASKIYVENKIKACESLNIFSESFDLPKDSTTDDLLYLVSSLNGRDDIDGILIQLPLPGEIDVKRPQIAVVDADQVRAGFERPGQLRVVVHFDKCSQPTRCRNS